MAASFHVFFSNALFTIAQIFDTLQSALLTASLNEVQINDTTPVISQQSKLLWLFTERFTTCVVQPKSVAKAAERREHWYHSLSNISSDLNCALS
jgi:hypothetical protein